MEQPRWDVNASFLASGRFCVVSKNMNKRNCLVAGGLLLLAVPGLVMGQSGVHRAKGSGGAGFDGTWIVDFQEVMPMKVNVWVVKDGMYRCASCTPMIEVK